MYILKGAFAINLKGTISIVNHGHVKVFGNIFTTELIRNKTFLITYQTDRWTNITKSIYTHSFINLL